MNIFTDECVSPSYLDQAFLNDKETCDDYDYESGGFEESESYLHVFMQLQREIF